METEPDIEHALRIVDRILDRLDHPAGAADATRGLRITMMEISRRLMQRTGPGDQAVQEALALGTIFVEQVEAAGAGDDRLGAHVRNFFECLGQAGLGATLSLRAGEDPDSLLRP